MDWEELFRIVEQAQELPKNEQEAWVREQCKENAELLRETMAILTAKVREGFMEAPKRKAGHAFGSGLEGRRFGDFLLLEEIARGGMGIIYRGMQRGLERPVAIKVLPQVQRSSIDVLERFRREADAASRVQHPHAVPVLAAGESDGIAWYAMPLVEGHDLAKEIEFQRDGRNQRIWPAFGENKYVARVVEQIAGVAEALEHIHQQGIVHRDIKPRNLLLNRDGQLFVVDFGLAKVKDHETMTSTGAVQGTPHYMSPEQARALSSPIDRRSDVYSLSAVLFELLALRKPVEGDSVEVILGRIASGTVLSLRKVNSRAPRDLVTICEKGMAHHPEHRYQTAGELAADLMRFRHLEAILAKPAPLHRRFLRYARTHRNLVTGIVLLLGMLAAGYVTSKYQSGRSRTHEYNQVFAAVLKEHPSQEDWSQGYRYVQRVQVEGAPAPSVRANFDNAKRRLEQEAEKRKSVIENLYRRGKGDNTVTILGDEWRAPRDTGALLQGVREAQRASTLFPGDPDLQSLSSIEQLLPKLTITLHPDSDPEAIAIAAGSVKGARQDPMSSLYGPWFDLGSLPLTSVPIEPGDWRFLVEVPGVGFGEYDRLVELETGQITISARILLTQRVLEGMLPIEVNGRMLPSIEPTDGEPTEYYATAASPYTIPNFAVDTAVLSNREYLEYMAATGAEAPSFWSACFEDRVYRGDWRELPVGNLGDRWLDLPVTGLPLGASRACAEYFGKRLLGHHESQLVTRGWEWSLYPWGNGPMPEGFAANLAAKDAPRLPAESKQRAQALWERLLPVREPGYAQPPFGLYHAFGNVTTVTWGPVVVNSGTQLTPSTTDRLRCGISAFQEPMPYRILNHTTFDTSDSMVDSSRGVRCAKGR